MDILPLKKLKDRFILFPINTSELEVIASFDANNKIKGPISLESFNSGKLSKSDILSSDKKTGLLIKRKDF